MAIEEKPDLILVEMSSPGIDGSAFCKALRGHSLGQATYIILLVNHEDEGLLSQALDMGADDILPQPITALAVHAKLRSAFKILQLQKELVKERNGLVNSAGEWAGTNRRLTQVAMTDPLTQLANRRHGQDFLSSEWAFAKANNLPLACLMIDIDHFKNVNDQNGHKAGDAILVKLANLLQASSRSGDLVFRFGGEEFCIICSGATLEMACAVAERVRRNVAGQAFQFGDIKISVTVSIGVATMTPVHVDEDALIHDADAAMYCAKKAGRNRVMSSVLTHTVMKRQIDWPLIHTQHELAEIAKLQHKRQNIYPLQGKTVGQILMHHGIISDETISVVRAIQKREAYKNKPIGETLVEIGIVNQDMLTRSLLIQAGIPMADVLSIDIPPEIIKIILIAKTHDKLAVPIGNYHNTLYLAVPDPFTFTDQPFFTVMTGMKVSLVFAPMHDIVNRLNIHGFSRKHGGMAKEEFSIPAKTV